MYVIKMLTKYRYRKCYNGGDDGILKISRQLVFFPPLYKGFRNDASHSEEETVNCPKTGLNFTSDSNKAPLMKQLVQDIMRLSKSQNSFNVIGLKLFNKLDDIVKRLNIIVFKLRFYSTLLYSTSEINFVRDRAYLLVFRTEPIR
ncbi:hypothetical protein ANN_15876, partial [Periplaneta americana]